MSSSTNTPSQTPPLDDSAILVPPKGLAILAVLGPGLMWCGEYIGSGEVILAPRAGAVLGIAMLWVPFIGIVTKFWIGLAGARYTVCTGEGMIDMMSRTPGPKNWVLWPVFAGQLASGAIATSAIANASGIFMHYFIPSIPSYWLGWTITLTVIAMVWSGKFDLLKTAMSILVLVIIIGVFDVAVSTWPGWGPIFTGIFGFQVPEVPEWARAAKEVEESPWREILPLLGWAAGGFASQVWYTYWVLGAGYGMTHGRGYGEPLDAEKLGQITRESALRLRGWCRVVACDATMATAIGIVVTIAFAIAGAGVLGPAQVAPKDENVAIELSQIFGGRWGEAGAHLYVLAALAALVSTLLGQFAGWPRLLADCARILVPGVAKVAWKIQFRTVLILYAFSNMVMVYSLGVKPVALVKLGAVLDGLLLTPLQALAVGLVLYLVMPRFYSEEVRKILKPHWIFAVGLVLAFLVFGYFCVFQIPSAIKG